jgi:hypothetical protein
MRQKNKRGGVPPSPRPSPALNAKRAHWINQLRARVFFRFSVDGFHQKLARMETRTRQIAQKKPVLFVNGSHQELARMETRTRQIAQKKPVLSFDRISRFCVKLALFSVGLDSTKIFIFSYLPNK